MPRLTIRLLRAMEESLNSRLAGEIDAEFGENAEGIPKPEDYEAALAWVQAQIGKRIDNKP